MLVGFVGDGRFGSKIEVDSIKLEKLSAKRSKRNVLSALNFERKMFNYRSRYLVVFITFGYKSEWQQMITLHQLQGDRDRLFANSRHNKILSHIRGTVWKLEEGGDGGGLHMHQVIFFDSAVRKDVYYGKELEEYWRITITRGCGTAHSANRFKWKYIGGAKGCALGQVNRNDDGKRQQLRSLLVYLAKEDQQVASRLHGMSKMFGTSQPPE